MSTLWNAFVVEQKRVCVHLFSSYLKKKQLNIKNIKDTEKVAKLEVSSYLSSECKLFILSEFSHHFHHKLFSKGESHAVQSVGADMTSDSLW